mmetsp:Transcript_23199/g.37816  ORF Transcript_23199/g.37816 Transcript_23199/m.37816 type:complete len:391 (+) Transcript_23199:149-1321(+)
MGQSPSATASCEDGDDGDLLCGIGECLPMPSFFRRREGRRRVTVFEDSYVGDAGTKLTTTVEKPPPPEDLILTDEEDEEEDSDDVDENRRSPKGGGAIAEDGTELTTTVDEPPPSEDLILTDVEDGKEENDSSDETTIPEDALSRIVAVDCDMIRNGDKVKKQGKGQEEQLQQVHRDMNNVEQEQESLDVQQNEGKENTIFQPKTDLRSTKEQLNEEKIRLRRSQIMQSRIPSPTKGTRNAYASPRKTIPSQRPSGLMQPSPPSSRGNASERKSDLSATDTPDRKKNEPNNVARIRYRVLKMLQEHDPAKVDKLDVVMFKFEGRETELLEKMIARYESGKDESKSVASTAEATESTDSSNDDGRPKSRQDKALEIHMARMKRRRASTSKG